MIALHSNGYGSIDQLEFREMEKPVPEDNEVGIRIMASSVNSWDLDLVRGKPFYVKLVYPGGRKRPKAILGCDVAGVVESVGPAVKVLKEGDRVFGDLSTSGWGGFAEYATAPEDQFALIPDNVSFEDAASIPQAGLLALQGLRNAGKVQAGEHVVLNGGGGGVGTLGIQLLREYGAEITVVDRAVKEQGIMDLGAHHFIDFEKTDYLEKASVYDVNLDVVGNRKYAELKRNLKTGGRYVMVGGDASLIFRILLGLPFNRKKKMNILPHETSKEDLKFFADRLADGRMKAIIDKTFAFDQIPQAIQHLWNGNVVGKVVISHVD